jgi:hypothetical protein
VETVGIVLFGETQYTTLFNRPYLVEPIGIMEKCALLFIDNGKKANIWNYAFFLIKTADNSRKNTSLMPLFLFIYLHYRKKNVAQKPVDLAMLQTILEVPYILSNELFGCTNSFPTTNIFTRAAF